MSPLHVLLRVLLCISLVFYGSGVAAAATRMQVGYATAAASSVPSAVTASGSVTAPCHEANDMAVPAGEDSVAALDVGTYASTSSSTEGSTEGSPDCCEATSCDCSCAQQVQVATGALGVGNLVPARSTAVRAMTMGHASPALPHLIRPPIA
jgi:hypothetical protein